MFTLENFTQRQRKLFETAHSEPLELKALAYALKRQGILRDKLYASPEFMLLPFQQCPRLAALTPAQQAILSATFFALQHCRTAHLETLTLTYNIETASRNFEPYSPDYMVLFHETNEEYDHLASFNILSEAFLGKPLDGDYSQCYSHSDKLRAQLAHWFSEMPPEVAGAYYLIYRFVQNVTVKQIETYLFADDDRIDELAVEFTKAHARDEARHFTTSFELGLYLFQKSPLEFQEKMRFFLKHTFLGWIVNTFLPGEHFAEPKTPFLSHELTDCVQPLSLLALKLACQRSDFGLNADTLLQSWKGLTLEPKPAHARSLNWVAWQIERMVNTLELDLNPQYLEAYLVRDDSAEKKRKLEIAERGLSHYRACLNHSKSTS